MSAVYAPDFQLSDLVGMLRRMLLIRAFETELYRQYDAGFVKGTLHVCIGQEAVAVGCCEPLGASDTVTSNHRGHGHFLAKGGSAARIMAEIFGRSTGYCEGRGGTQHMASKEHGFLCSNGISGGGLPIATGLALAHKLHDTPHVAVCFFGDGASNQGTFHESLNIAAIWRLPIIYVCENNQYAMSSAAARMLGGGSVCRRAAGYGIHGESVDGNDVVQVARRMRVLVARAREGAGPALLEAHTYRMLGHSRNDRCRYRPAEEAELWHARCPVARLAEALVAAGLLDAGRVEELRQDTQREVEAAVVAAQAADCLTRARAVSGVFR